MSYQVLARKYRSQTFDEVVGQEPIVTTLAHAIERDRVHHGYLFCGTRGVGKTSMARLLAKALNCLSSDGPTATPCGTCDSCVSIARGEDVDVVEIDAASHTGVDNIRELRANAIYRPTRARFKIYIIDEVHMLSTGAFNALLKTLEEPPSHVKFIFATTEPQKVPATIQSRVQRFDFRSIPAGKIAEQISRILDSEGVPADEPAVKRIARLANGSMRDALSLLDQALSVGGKSITTEVVNEIFPAAHDELFADLIDRFADGDAAGALTVVDESLGRGHTLDHWCELLIEQLRTLMLLNVCGTDTDLIDVPAGLRTDLIEQAKKFDSGAYVYMIAVLEELRRSVKQSGSGRPLVEAAVIRLCDASRFASIDSLLARLDGEAPPAQSAPSSTRAPAPSAPPPQSKRPPALGQKMKTNVQASSETATTAQAAQPQPAGAEYLPAVSPAPAARPPAPTPQIPARRMTQADLKAAKAEPMVRAALELFGGRIVHVQRGTGGQTPPADPTRD